MGGSEREGKLKKNGRRKWGKVCGSEEFVGRVFLVGKKSGK